MTENLAQKLKAEIEKGANSIFKFASDNGFKTASLNYAIVNNSFRLEILEQLGTTNEKLLNIIINHFISLSKNNDFIPDTSPLLQEIENLKKEVATLQQNLINSNQMLIDCQQKIINQK